MKKNVGLLIAVIFCNAFLSVSGQDIQNPVLDMNFADPTVITGHDGKYYAYATNSGHDGKTFHIQVAVSDDLKKWDLSGDALPEKPSWASHDFWAPHVLYDKALKKYIMFYSGESTDTLIGKCQGVAFSDSPLGPFTDKGEPLLCGEGFVNIDPMAIIDPATNKKLLYWGSGFKPIKVQELSDDWKSFKKGSTAKDLVPPGKEKDYTRLLEGAWISFHDGYYYLYYSGDNCCGDKASYAVMVARSKKSMGPFTRLGEANGTGNSVVLEKDEMWNAPGHNSIIRDKDGREWIVYHAIKRSQPKAGRVMCIKPVSYQNGWPAVGKTME